MMDKNEVAKLGLAFAVGVSLSAGYVVLGLQMRAPDVVVVQEQCPDPEERAKQDDERSRPEGLELAPLVGEEPVPDGFSLWLGLDGLWTGDAALLELEDGRFAAADLDRHTLRALEPVARERARFSSTAVLWIDHRVAGATLIDLLFTLERAGFREFALVVESTGGPTAFRFESKVYGSFVDTEDPWTAALALRLEEQGVSAWLTPRSEGRPPANVPEPLPIACQVDDIAKLEGNLCVFQSRPWAVEFTIAPERSVGELLAMRAADERPQACRGPSNLVAPDASAPACEEAIPIGVALERFAAMASLDSPDSVKASVEGSLDKEQVREVVRKHIGDVRACYNEGLLEDPELEGRVIVDFVIGEKGKVVESAIDDRTDLPDRKTSRCIVDAVSSWKFPAPAEGEVVVTYPFALSPG
jgi:hypothetical protein